MHVWESIISQVYVGPNVGILYTLVDCKYNILDNLVRIPNGHEKPSLNLLQNKKPAGFTGYSSIRKSKGSSGYCTPKMSVFLTDKC